MSDPLLGDALDLVENAASSLFQPAARVNGHLSLAREGLVNAGWVDGLREERLEEVDYHLAAAAEHTENESIVIPVRNARQLLRGAFGGETA